MVIPIVDDVLIDDGNARSVDGIGEKWDSWLVWPWQRNSGGEISLHDVPTCTILDTCIQDLAVVKYNRQTFQDLHCMMYSGSERNYMYARFL